MTGEKRNCIAAHTAAKSPKAVAPPEQSPPVRRTTRPGKTGAARPNASMSSRTVMKMKANAARVRVIAGE
jgi:hypothetical protein